MVENSSKKGNRRGKKVALPAAKQVYWQFAIHCFMFMLSETVTPAKLITNYSYSHQENASCNSIWNETMERNGMQNKKNVPIEGDIACFCVCLYVVDACLEQTLSIPELAYNLFTRFIAARSDFSSKMPFRKNK